MSVRTPHRFAGVVAPVVAAALLLGACGSGGEGATRETVIDLGESTSTNYQTIPPATTTTTIVGEVEEVGTEQEYTVQAGDYGIKVADMFGVSLADLESINGWVDAGKEFPDPGSVIKIPAGGKLPSSTTDTGGTDTGGTDTGGTDTGADTAGTESGDAGEAIPDPGSNCEAGSYVIEAGDTTRTKVADKFDITVDAMDAANADTPGYDAFYPGLKIIIPAKDSC